MSDRALDIVRDLANRKPWNITIDDASNIVRGWHCIFCSALVKRHAGNKAGWDLRDGEDAEHKESCVWQRARMLLGAADPHGKQDAP